MIARLQPTVVLAALSLASGCSLTNVPDRDALPPDSGTMDSSVDADAGDAGDAGDGGDACGSNELCTGREDDDCDGLIDCADPDCASLEACCMGGATMTRDWGTTEFMSWDALPSDGAMNYPMTNAAGNIREFPADVQGILRRRCVPLATGYRLKTSFQMAEATCPEVAGGCFAALVITPAPGAPTGARIADDIAVTIDENGSLEATNSGRSLGTSPDGFVSDGQRVDVTISVTVGVDEGGAPSLLGTVGIVRGAETETLVSAFPFAPIASLITGEADCEDVGGLRVAVEGFGSQFEVFPLVREPLECINVGRFDEPTTGDRVLSAAGGGPTTDLGWGEWTAGGLGSPGLAAQDVDGDLVWHLVGDGTNYDRTQDPVAVELGFAIGYSKTEIGDWNGSWRSDSSAGPKIGPCNPACTAVAPAGCTLMCPSMGPPDNSMRDPSFGVLPIGPRDTTTQIAYARRDGPDRYGIAVEESFRIATSAQGEQPSIIRTEDVPGAEATGMPCTSLRDPVLVAVDPTDATRGQWLFYSCYFALEDAEIHAIRLDPAFAPDMDSHRVLVTPSSTGAWAGSSVWSPELVVEYEPPGMGSEGRHLYRLWFLGRNRTRDRVSIGLLQGQLDATQSMASALPTFTAFGGNPVLREGREAFGDCPECSIEGFTVARVPNTEIIRFLIARQDNAGVPEDWHYAPFEQFWRSPWAP